jgi:hypothetical protein
MKRTLSAFVAFASFFAATCYAQTAPGGVCISNVTLTISNGYTAPVPFALVTLCSAGSTQANCTANKQPIFTSTALSTTTPTNPFRADVGGNYFFCASVGHYALMLAGSQGTYFVNDIALVDDWSLGGTVSGPWSVTALTIPPLSTSTPHCLQVGAGGVVAPTTFPCGNSYATGTVASVTVGAGWPSWFAPNISNPTTVPSINATVTAIPNSALANPSTTVNGTVCTLGAACTLSGGIDYYWTITGCTVGVGQPNRCTGTTVLPGAMPDANYQVFCGTNDITYPTGSTVCGLYNGGTLPTASGAAFTYEVLQVMQNSSGGATPQVYFHAHHN